MNPALRTVALHPSVAALSGLHLQAHAGKAARFINDLYVGGVYQPLSVEGFRDEIRRILEAPDNNRYIAPYLGMDPFTWVAGFIDPMIQAGMLQLIPINMIDDSANRIRGMYWNVHELSVYDAEVIALSLWWSNGAPLVVADERLRSLLTAMSNEAVSVNGTAPQRRLDVWWIADYPWEAR